MSVTDHFMWQDYNFTLLVASFGASAVLLYGVPESKLSQPRNLIGASCVDRQSCVCAAAKCVCVCAVAPHMLAAYPRMRSHTLQQHVQL